MYGLTLVLTLAVVGGVIAYIGDRLGMSIGRKKLTLFGLRPKHTSILVTIVTGVFIASASIGVLTIASQDVRTALFRMKEIQNELQVIQTSYDEMRQQRDTAQQELLEAEERTAEALASYENVILELRKAEEQVELQRASISQNEETIAEMEENIDRLQAEAAALQQDISKLLAVYADLEEKYDEVYTAFGQIRGSNIAFNASEVILTTVIPQGLGRTEIREALEEFLAQVDKVAYARSARQATGPYRAIYLRPNVLDFAVEDLLLAHNDVIVRAVSESNTIPGVPVVVYLESYANQMVFPKGTVLAEASWDPDDGTEIDRLILQMLNQANGYAIEVGMAMSDDRVAVQLPGNAFLDAIFASRSIAEPVTVQLVVGEDTWRTDTPVQVYLNMVQ